MVTINTQNLVEFGTLLGIFLAFYQYFKSSFERQKQIIIGVKEQLKVSSIWASTENDGYVGVPDDLRKLDYSNPFRFIFGIENTTSRTIMVQLGIADFSLKFHEAVNQYNQIINSISDVERFIEKLAFSNTKISEIIQEKLKRERLKPEGEQTYLSFSESFNLSDPEQKHAKYVAEKISYYNKYLHYDLIGSKSSEGLHHYHDVLTEEIKKQEIKIEHNKQVVGIFLGMGFAVLVVSFLSLGNISLDTWTQWILIFVEVTLFSILFIKNK